MAQVFSTYIYGIDYPGGQYNSPFAGGELNGFSAAAVHIYPAPANTTKGVGNVTCVSVVEVPATGLNQPARKFYSAQAVATLVTAANA